MDEGTKQLILALYAQIEKIDAEVKTIADFLALRQESPARFYEIFDVVSRRTAEAARADLVARMRDLETEAKNREAGRQLIQELLNRD
jgi:hypothetical protein